MNDTPERSKIALTRAAVNADATNYSSSSMRDMSNSPLTVNTSQGESFALAITNLLHIAGTRSSRNAKG